MNNIFVLFGYPLKSSLSPLIHNATLKNGIYFIQPVKPASLLDAIKALKILEWKGANVTIPYKQTVMKYLDKIDQDALIAGAVNTILNEDGILTGYNTDVLGFQETIKHNSYQEATIVGAGGAARAIIVALIRQGCKRFKIYNRTRVRVSQLIRDLAVFFPEIEFEYVEEQHYVKKNSILVNCTPLDNPLEHFPIAIDDYQTVYDLKYADEIALLKIAAQKGVKNTLNGLEMLILQAAYAQEIWTGRFPDLTKMKEAIK